MPLADLVQTYTQLKPSNNRKKEPLGGPLNTSKHQAGEKETVGDHRFAARPSCFPVRIPYAHPPKRPTLYGSFRKYEVPYFRVLIIRILIIFGSPIFGNPPYVPARGTGI